ncbi:hypothetical protein ACFX2A_007136 [Malus domestica]
MKLIQTSSHEAENPIELSLRQAFELLEPKLRPPFALTIPNPQEYLLLNKAILYGVLCESHVGKTHMKHLHAIVTDGYFWFVSLLVKVVNELYVKLLEPVKSQLIWVTKELINVLAVGVDGLLVCLLRQIIGGDYSDGNLWLCFEMVSIFMTKWDCLLEVEPMILTSGLYTYLRLLADHCRLLSNPNLEALKQLEVDFCIKVFKEKFPLCLKIGRDLVRLLQDLVHLPKFRTIWKDLVLNRGEFKAQGFSGIPQLYNTRTPSEYMLLRITPEMEAHLRFLLTHVKLGNQKRHQAWFSKKFLFEPNRKTLIIDIVRFICCAYHPTNEIIQSDVIPRWAIMGWLFKSCTKNYVEANVKLALLYDWLFFKEKADNIMDIEPAMLLMVYSIPRYIDVTHTILEFLFLLMDNYDVEHYDILAKGVSSSFSVLVKRGVIRSLDVLTSCDALSPILKERLGRFLSGRKFEISKELQQACRPADFVSLNSSCMETPLPLTEWQPKCSQGDKFGTKSAETKVMISDDAASSHSPLVVAREGQVHDIDNMIHNLGEAIKNSNPMALRTLEELLLLFVSFDGQGPESGFILHDVLSSKIKKLYELSGSKLFSPLKFHPDSPENSDEVGSATSLIIRMFVLSQHQNMQAMLLFWLKNGFPVGARLLLYASRLAYEARMVGFFGDAMVDVNSITPSDSGIRLLLYHVNGYFSFLHGRTENSYETIESISKAEKKLVAMLVDGAFAAYKCFLVYSRTALFKDAENSLPQLLFSDIITCSVWERKRLKFLFSSVYCHLSDISIGEEGIIKLLVGQLDHADLVNIQIEIGLKRFSIFGENTETVFRLMKNSLNWGCMEQHKFWGLIRSELAVSMVQVQGLLSKFFWLEKLDANASAIAVEGLLTLCSCCPPTPELVGALMLLPNSVFQDFASAVMAKWAVSNGSMLFESLAEFSEKVESKNGDLVIHDSAGMLNRSAILWLLKYFNGSDTDISGNLSLNTMCKNAMRQV